MGVSMKWDWRVVNTDMEAVLGALVLLVLGVVGSAIGVMLYLFWLVIWGPQ